MNTDIYIEYDLALADRAITEKYNKYTIKDIAMFSEAFPKWLQSTEKWRKKCKTLRLERPWSATKRIFTATVKKPTYKKVK